MEVSNEHTQGSTTQEPGKSGQTLDTILPEIILSIFELLTYDELRFTIPLVCKQFRNIIHKKTDTSASTIDKILWRDSPRCHSRGQRVRAELHPILPKVGYKYIPVPLANGPSSRRPPLALYRNDAPLFLRPPSPWDQRLIDVPQLCHENVSRPSARTALYHFGHPQVPDLRINGTGDGGGVTVHDVLKSVSGAMGDGTWYVIRVMYTTGILDGIGRGEILDGVLHLYDTCIETSTLRR